MKKILLTILVFVLSLLLANVAMPAAPKPPASICLYDGNTYYAFVVKSSGSIKMFDGTRKFYSIQGAIMAGSSPNMPLVGSGYVEGNVFHFVFSTAYNLSGTPYFGQGEVFWDLIAETGTAYVYISLSGNNTFSLTQVACTQLEIVYSGESGAALPNEGSPYRPRNQ